MLGNALGLEWPETGHRMLRFGAGEATKVPAQEFASRSTILVVIGMLVAVSLAFQSSAAGDRASLVVKRGAYGILDSVDPGDVRWAGAFGTIEAGGILDPCPPGVMATLRNAGVDNVLAYDWMPAGYHYVDGEPDTTLMKWVVSNRTWATLNPSGPYPHCTEEGYGWCQDLYYDLGADDVMQRRVEWLDSFAHSHGYDGFFFDWASGGYLWDPAYDSMREEWNRRHPMLDYRTAVRSFYAALAARGLLIHTNQAFRQAKYGLLQTVDWDMAESYVTDCGPSGHILDVEGVGPVEVWETMYYPLSEDVRHGELEDTIEKLDELSAIRKQYAGPRFRAMVYLSYAAPDFVPSSNRSGAASRAMYTPVAPRNAIFFSLAVPMLAGQIGYTQTLLFAGSGELPVRPRSLLSQDPVYFLDLGRPLGDGYETVSNGSSHFWVRYYQGGVVLVGRWVQPTTVHLQSPWIPGSVPVWDAFEKTWSQSDQGTLDITVSPVPTSLFDPRPAPVGRIYAWGVRDLRIERGAMAFVGEVFHLSASYVGGSNVRCVWDFGDGTRGSGCQVSHVWMHPGVFTVTVSLPGTSPRLEAAQPVQVTVAPRHARGRVGQPNSH